MIDANIVHTADLPAAAHAAARELLFEVFDDMADDDWEHCLGGLHAIVWDGSTLVGHAALIQRRIIHSGRALRVGYVEGVAVRAGYRRQGYGAAVMAPLERAINAAYDLGALGATDEAVPFYLGRRWQRWLGPTSALTPGGVVPTPEDDDAVFVFPGAGTVDVTGSLTCDWRDGDVW